MVMKRVPVKVKMVNLLSIPEPKFQCPKCGIWAYGEGHLIDEKGHISPSLICSCGWHGWGKVENIQMKEK